MRTMREHHWLFFSMQLTLAVGTSVGIIATTGNWNIVLGVILGYGVGQAAGFLMSED